MRIFCPVRGIFFPITGSTRTWSLRASVSLRWLRLAPQRLQHDRRPPTKDALLIGGFLGWPRWTLIAVLAAPSWGHAWPASSVALQAMAPMTAARLSTAARTLTMLRSIIGLAVAVVPAAPSRRITFFPVRVAASRQAHREPAR